MTPTPQELPNHQGEKPRTPGGAKVVISGMSGLYPQSTSVKELSDILYNKENPVKDINSRWKFQHPEVVEFTGKVPNLERFDAQFFKVHFRLGNNMDAMGRKVLEQAYQAIYDAGVSPEHLSGKKVGVYVGTCFSETEKACFYVATSRTGFGIAGCSKTMFANRISYWLNAKGPSMAIDEACCSSIAALEQAYLAISRGECEAAIVGGTNLCLHPQSSVHYSRIMQMCKDGKTKSFDENADGCAKSEAINVLFLQKAEDALRIYAEVVLVNSEYTALLKETTMPRYGFYRDPMTTTKFLKNFYSKAGISPSDVEYVEAFGSAVPEADKSELEAIDNVFCKSRDVSLPVGSVMSNIGYGEAASGISAITKVLLGYENGLLAGNLHLTTPRQDVAAMREGRIEVITDHCSFRRTYVGVNALSITGINAHVLLHGHYKPKDLNRYNSSIPRIVTISGRQESAVKKIIDDLKSRPIDPEELALLHNIHETKISGHMGRGFIILDTKDQKTVSLTERVEYFDEMKRPLWFVYSGMGSQWPGMGEQLMRIPIFAAAIERCRRILEPKGIDLLKVLLSRDKTIFDNILHSFVGIAAVQIGLTDILRALGLTPDKIIGHSVGELGCAYADGCLTAEEMILASYYRGLVSIQTPFIRGSMAAVGLGFQQIKNICPPEIEIACHNGPQSSTISGPEKEMRTFVADLSAKGIFAKEVPCSNIAYHSRYIADAGPGLLKYMKEVIKEPKLRSEKWVSSSVPLKKWNEPSAKYCSAEYLTNNLLNPVLFEETATLIPSNAVLVEIAPHGLLQAILKRSLHSNCQNIGLTRRGHPDNAYLILEAVGQLYIQGYIPKVKALYPKVEFPVSTGTPMLSHQVEWVHNEIWSLPLYVAADKVMAASSKFVISIHDEEHKYLRGHVIRGKILYPFAAVLVSVWDTLSMILNTPKRQISVQFSDIHFYVQPVLHNQRQLRLSISIHRGTGRFEVLDEKSKVATGFITNKELTLQNILSSNEVMDYSVEDIYELLNMRDYSYSDDFKSIHSVNTAVSEALLEWNENWVTLIDGMLQLNALRQTHAGVTEPKHIRSLYIDHSNHRKFGESTDGKILMRAQVSDIFDNTRCGGILIENIKFYDLPLLSSDKFTLKKLKFIPHFGSSLDVVTALHVYLQIVAENIDKKVLNIVGIRTQETDLQISKEIKNLDYIPSLVIKYNEVSLDDVLRIHDQASEVDLIVLRDLPVDEHLYQILHRVLQRGTFILNYNSVRKIEQFGPSVSYHQVCSAGNVQLLRWGPKSTSSVGAAFTVRNESDLPMLSTARSRLRPGSRMLVYAPYPSPPGLTDLLECWRKESPSNQINIILANSNITDEDFFNTDADLAYNVWNDGVWGGEYYIPWHEEHAAKQRILLQSLSIGDLRSLQWVVAPELPGPGVKVTIHYAGIHSGDILKATGMTTFKDDNIPDGYGMDFSGVTESNERVMGIVLNGACSSEVLAQPELLWPVPEHWSLEDAATVPLAYMHAFYCLKHQSIGDRILLATSEIILLVHGGAGSLGQAVISVALSLGYRVFTTVSDVHKKRFLLKLFPQLKDEHVGNSRDASFGDMILSATKDVGCHIIISCVKGDLKNISLKCCAFSGVTLDTTVVSQREDYEFGLANLSEERSYISVDFTSILKYRRFEEIRELHRYVSEGIASGCVRPLSRITYEPNNAVRAFRLMETSQHRGKVLLQLEDSIDVRPRFDCKADSCNLLICDQGNVGLQLVDRLVSRGAKKLHLHYINPTAYLRYKIRKWRDLDVEVTVSSGDLRNERNIFSLIHNALHLGPLEGIYVIAMSTNNGYDQGFLNHLDALSRKLCTNLRYFAVVSSHDSFGLHTCLSRVKDNYPAVKLRLDALRMVNNNNEEYISANSARGIIDVIESSVNKNNLILAAKPLPEGHVPLIHQIAAVADVCIQEEDVERTLKEFGLDNVKAHRVTQFLRRTHNISYDDGYVQSLTVQDVRDLEKILTESIYENIKGLETFYTYVDPDELLATAETVTLSTLTNSTTTRDDEFDGSQTYLCIIPGLEGHYKRFCNLSERLKLHALVLQPGLDKPYETIKELADRYTQILLKKLVFKNNFYLLGYEVGVLVALEIAANLEKQGLQGTVFCIGNDPDEIKLVLEEQLREFKTDEELQNAVIRHMFKLMAEGGTIRLETELSKVSSWHEKIEVCVRTLLGRVSHSAQYARGLIEAAFARIKQAKCYNANKEPLRSKLVLLRSASCAPSSSDAITARSLQPVAIHNFTAPLRYATEDLRCTAIINKYLDEDLLEAFENKNLCETYVLNADTFMSSSLTTV